MDPITIEIDGSVITLTESDDTFDGPFWNLIDATWN